MANPINQPSNPPAMPVITRRPGRSDALGVTVSNNAACSLLELLELCDLFLRTATPAVRAELKVFLDTQPTPLDANLLIDMLGFNALYLDGVLTLADIHRAGTPDSLSQGPA
jgi:hypothetical protein